ncbi:hypothetical protein [Bibersteinia trehalosi]|uniref:hypothetical protein n=1 Tax=Bibersteinia trehalosi TaxID=47735 RepID=UPI002D79025B|nr:hypothetical protein [Bibersteinia trehalosi]
MTHICFRTTATVLAKLQEAERLKTEAERWETGGDHKRKAAAEAALQAAEKTEDFAKQEEKQTAYAEAKARKESWEDGGANKRRLDAAVMVLTSMLSGGSAGQMAVAAVSLN